MAELAAELQRVRADGPREVVDRLERLVVVDERGVALFAKARESGDVDVRHLRNHDTGIVRPEIGELPALDSGGRRVVALHANPELSLQEKATSAFVQQRLTELGISFTAGIGGHGE